MNPVALLIAQIGDELLAAGILIASDGQSLGSVGAEPALGHLHPLRAEGEVVVALMELGGILEVNFEEGPAFAIIRKVHNPPRIPGRPITPSKATRGESLRHRPAVEVVGVVVAEPGGRLIRLIASNLGVVCLRVPLGDRADAAAESLLAGDIHVRVGQQLELRACVLEEGVPGETRQSIVVSGVEAIRFVRAAPEALEDIGKESNV